MYQTEMETVLEGWLKKKSQNEKKLFRPKTAIQKSNQYWFVLKQSGDIPGQYILDYYTDTTCKKQKGHVDLDQCRKIERKIDALKPDEYLFSIETTKRTYNLLAQTKADLDKWIQCLCTVCGFKPNRPETLLLQDQSTKQSINTTKQQQNETIIIVTYSNPNIAIDSPLFNQSSTLLHKNLTNNQLATNQSSNNHPTKEKISTINFDNVLTKKWSSTLTRSSNFTNNNNTKATTSTSPSSESFCSATLPNKRTQQSSFSSAYIPISECHTGKSIFETIEDKKMTTATPTTTTTAAAATSLTTNEDTNNKFSVKFDVKFDEDDRHSPKLNNNNNNNSESNKENKFNGFDRSQCLLDSSINSTQDLILDLNYLNSRASPNQSNDDMNYDVPRQVKIYKKSKIKDLLNLVPSPPSKTEILYSNSQMSNAMSLSRDRMNRNSNKNLASKPATAVAAAFELNYTNSASSSSLPKSDNHMANNYINSIEFDRHASFRETVKEREYYNNINELNLTLPPPRPKSAKPISIPKQQQQQQHRQSTTSLNSLNDHHQHSTDLNEFDPLQQQQQQQRQQQHNNNNNLLMNVPKVPQFNLATSPDLMYSIPKSQVELELEKKAKQCTKSKNILDTVVPLTHNLSTTNGKLHHDELHRYTNAASDVFVSTINNTTKPSDGGQIIYEYENPTLPCNLNSSLNDNNNQFKIPAFKLNDKSEPITPSQIVTSTPLFSNNDQSHFNFNQSSHSTSIQEQDDSFIKPQVNRDLKPKKSDTSIESLLIYNSNKSPINRHSDTLINRSSLNSSFNLKSNSSSTTNNQSAVGSINPPRIPSRGRQFGTKIILNSNLPAGEEINKPKPIATKRHPDYAEIQYLDLDLDGDNMSLNSTINETSINLNFKDNDLMNISILNNTLNTNNQTNQLNNSFNTQSSLNYSQFIFLNSTTVAATTTTTANTTNATTKQSHNNQDNQNNNHQFISSNNNGSQFSILNSSITNPSTVYKTVDFIKTRAFNELKDGLNRKTQD